MLKVNREGGTRRCFAEVSESRHSSLVLVGAPAQGCSSPLIRARIKCSLQVDSSTPHHGELPTTAHNLSWVIYKLSGLSPSRTWPASGQHWSDTSDQDSPSLEPYWSWPDSGTQRSVTFHSVSGRNQTTSPWLNELTRLCCQCLVTTGSVSGQHLTLHSLPTYNHMWMKFSPIDLRAT